jgi:hypothetical protein
MSVRNKSIAFLSLCFALSWAVVFGCWAAGVRDATLVGLVLVCMMAGPAIAALICAFAFEPRGQRRAALGLHWKPNRWWLFAWAGVIAIAALSVVLTLLFSGQFFVPIGEAARAAALAQGQDLSRTPAFALSSEFIFAMALLIAPVINTLVLTFTEELGWRGYLHHLWRGAGFWRCSLNTGAIWGAWHAPATLLYGLNYPDNADIGVFLFVFYCVLLAPIMTFFRDRGRSVIAAGVAHGTFNAVGGLTIGSLSAPAFPWNGIVGIGGFLALALAVAAIWWLQRSARHVA